MNYKQLSKTVLTIISLAALIPEQGFTSDTSKLESQRKLFSAVEKTLLKKDNTLYNQNLKELEGYPLMPHLHSLAFINRMSELAQKDIDTHINKWPTAPSNKRMQQQWLLFLATKNRWSDYLTAFERSDVQGSKYQCLNGMAQYKLGKKKEAWEQASKLWLVGKSQNKACNPLFKAWRASGGLTQDLAFKRFWLATEKNKIAIARYADKFITKKTYKKQTTLFWQIHNNPQELVTTKKLDMTQTKHRFIYLYGLKKLARKNIVKATKLWLPTREIYPFTLDEISKLDQTLAMRWAKNFKTKANQYIPQIDPLFSYPKVTEWRIRLALTQQNWGNVLTLSKQLPKEYMERSRWKYWQAVATVYTKKQLGQLDDLESILTQDAFSDLSKQRGYYGFLVADMSNTPFKLNPSENILASLPLKELMLEFDALARIQEWVYHKRFHKAQAELNRLRPLLTPEQRKMVAYLAQQWEWHYQAILTAARESLWDSLHLRFPSPMSDVFDQFSKKQELDNSWVISIARQESAFNPRAYSSAGARGLMQLMPATAKQTARNHKIKYRRVTDLYLPKVNIALGTAHLSVLINKFKENKIFATAAYNAGASRVGSWLKQRGHLPLDIWIETIPYDETRQYVQNVLAFQVIYNSLNSRETRMLSTKEASMISISALSPRALPLSESLLTQAEEE